MVLANNVSGVQGLDGPEMISEYQSDLVSSQSSPFPLSICGSATANLSASGSLATIASAPTDSAILMAQSNAPGSSGFGN